MDKKNNKGFSLVELIIVIAIIATLIGVLAPQYLKFVTNSRVATDITNATEIAKAIDATVSASDNTGAVPSLIQGPGGTAVTNVSGLTSLPASKLDAGYEWIITVDPAVGVQSITLNGYEVYPKGEGAGTFHDQYYVE